MDYLIFFLITISVVIYLFIQCFSMYKLLTLNNSENKLRVDKIYQANETFKVLILSMGIFFSILILFIPKSFSLYEHIFIAMLSYLLGVTALYESSTKSISDVLMLSILVMVNNVVIFLFPTLFLMLINMVHF